MGAINDPHVGPNSGNYNYQDAPPSTDDEFVLDPLTGQPLTSGLKKSDLQLQASDTPSSVDVLNAAADIALQDGVLTAKEKESLLQLADMAMPALPSADQSAVQAWITKINSIPTSQNTAAQAAESADEASETTGADAGDEAVKSSISRWNQPSFISQLYPLLVEIMKITINTTIQSSKLEQNMILLTLAYAKAAAQYSLAATQAQAQQMRIDATMYHDLMVSNFVQMGVSIAQAVATGAVHVTANELADSDIRKSAGTKLMDDKERFTTRMQLRGTYNSLYSGMSNELFQATQQGLSAWQNMIQADASSQKATQKEIEGQMTAMKELIDKLINTLSQTEQKASESTRSAQDQLQKIIDLMQDFSKTVGQIWSQ